MIHNESHLAIVFLFGGFLAFFGVHFAAPMMGPLPKLGIAMLVPLVLMLLMFGGCAGAIF